ncbi:PREDICTED: transcription factor TGA2.3-like [Nelumbo nucifera]|uniref:Transcription factor TGA2.3-like n=1 Tax=Nelumbo nucifera TaxID=4432 RepID=A0A1U8BJ30_NELNU|nr:PREDICTED: transcription factor TGA2.3-like [Nelumbo nucifera]
MNSQVQGRFSEFYEKWLHQLETNLQELLSVPRDQSHEAKHRALVIKAVTHYKEYYTAKWAAAHEDILGFFCPPWLTPLENAYIWMTDWRPSVAFRLVHSLRHTHVPGPSLEHMSEEQLKRMVELRTRIRSEEQKVEMEMERQQVGLADRRMVELARLATRVRNGEVVGELDGFVDAALKTVLEGLERVMKTADCLRLKALKGVLDVLTPLQCVDFMAATLMLKIQMRRWGEKRELGLGHDNSN